MKAPGSGVWGRQGKIWYVLEVGRRAGHTVPSLCCVIPCGVLRMNRPEGPLISSYWAKRGLQGGLRAAEARGA